MVTACGNLSPKIQQSRPEYLPLVTPGHSEPEGVDTISLMQTDNVMQKKKESKEAEDLNSYLSNAGGLPLNRG